MVIMIYNKKPEQIEAVQWTGNNIEEITTLLGFTPANVDESGLLINSQTVNLTDYIAMASYRNVLIMSETEFLNQYQQA